MKHQLEKDEIKLLEHVDKNVSDKYVPIFTTDIMALLEPEFTFEYGLQITPASSAHFVSLKNDDTNIRVYNSFDRSMALRIDMVADGISIPLGIEKLIHIGQKAKNFQEEFNLAKQDILDAVVTAKVFTAHLQNTKATKEIAAEITKSIFVHGKGSARNKGITKINNYTDLLLEKGITLSKYINLSIRSFLTGEYTYIKDGKKINGKSKRSLVYKLHLENRLIKTLQEKFPEFFL